MVAHPNSAVVSRQAVAAGVTIPLAVLVAGLVGATMMTVLR